MPPSLTPRALPELSKHILLYLLPLSDAETRRQISTWLSESPTSDPGTASNSTDGVSRALADLTRNGILLTTDGDSTPSRVSPLFREGLRATLVAGPGGPSVPPALLALAPPADTLAAYAQDRWEALLLFLIDAQEHAPPVLPVTLAKRKYQPIDPAALLEACGLRTAAETGFSLLKGSDRRFEFIMQPPAQQLWQIIRGYLTLLRDPSNSLVGGNTFLEKATPSPSTSFTSHTSPSTALGSVASLLLHVSFLDPGRPMALDAFTPTQAQILAHLAQLGLIMPLGDGSTVCATHLARVLQGRGRELGRGFGPTAGATGGGWIVTETNFRIYAYTSSRIHHTVLRQFCAADCVLPNLFVGTISYRSLDAAFNQGLTASAIITYLQEHAHPSRPQVPKSIADQIRLWEGSMRRIKWAPATAYNNWESLAFYQEAWAVAHNHGFLLYPRQPMMLKEGESEEAVRGWPIVVQAVADETFTQFIRDNKARFVPTA